MNPTSEAGLSVAATPRRRKVPATPSSPVAAAIMLLPEKMRRWRRCHPVATRRRRSFRPVASEFGMNMVPLEQLSFESFAGLAKTNFRVWINDRDSLDLDRGLKTGSFFKEWLDSLPDLDA
jgi:hypothetical protein